MIKRIACLCLVLLFLQNLPVKAAPPDEHIVVAVMDFGTHQGAATSDINLTAAEQAACDYIIERLTETGHFYVVDREMMQERLEQERLNTTGLIDPDTAKRVGEILGVRYIIYGNVVDMTASGTGTRVMSSGVALHNVKCHIIARMMDVEGGDIIMAAKGEGKSTSSLVKLGTEELGTVTIGTQRVSQVSVHNALKKAAFSTVDKLTERLFTSPKESQ